MHGCFDSCLAWVFTHAHTCTDTCKTTHTCMHNNTHIHRHTPAGIFNLNSGVKICSFTATIHLGITDCGVIDAHRGHLSDFRM